MIFLQLIHAKLHSQILCSLIGKAFTPSLTDTCHARHGPAWQGFQRNIMSGTLGLIHSRQSGTCPVALFFFSIASLDTVLD